MKFVLLLKLTNQQPYFSIKPLSPIKYNLESYADTKKSLNVFGFNKRFTKCLTSNTLYDNKQVKNRIHFAIDYIYKSIYSI